MATSERNTRLAGLALTAGGAAALVARQVKDRIGGDSGEAEEREPRSRWRAVTIDRSVEEVMPDGRVPGPLAALGDLVEVETRPAPGDRGTELRARLREAEPSGVSGAASRVIGDDPRQQVRAALREAKQLVEVGEVLRVDPTPHGQRPATPGGALVEGVTKRAGGEGVL